MMVCCMLYESFEYFSTNVEPAVNRQPGFRRGAVEQSAFNNTHTSKNNLYVLFFGPTDGTDKQADECTDEGRGARANE